MFTEGMIKINDKLFDFGYMPDMPSVCTNLDVFVVELSFNETVKFSAATTYHFS